MRVFNTVELLEGILSGLSTKSLTRARQVNSFFRDCIDTSIPLKRIMYLLPIPSTQHETFTHPQGFFPDDGCPTRTTTILHPAITTSIVPCAYMHIQPPPAHWVSGGQQWEDMLISQPPAAVYHVLCTSPAYQPGFWDEFTHQVRIQVEGNTLGALRKAVENREAKLEVEGLVGQGFVDGRAEPVQFWRKRAGKMQVRMPRIM